PVLGKRLQVDLGLDPLSITAMGEDLYGAREVNIGDLAALDVGIGGGVKRALRGIRHSLCAHRSSPKVAKSVSEPGGQVKLAASRSLAGSLGQVGVERTTRRVRCPGVAGLHPGAPLTPPHSGNKSLRPPPDPATLPAT